jgi:cell division protein FtsZ
MLERSVRLFQMRGGAMDESIIQQMRPDDICFYRFIGGNPSETESLIEHLQTIKESNVLLIGLFRFPFRFEGKKRQQMATEQYFIMRDLSDAIIYFSSDGMMEMVDPDLPIREAHIRFSIFEEKVILELEKLIGRTGEMNIDARDVQTFIYSRTGPLFFHSFEGESFDEPLKYAISAPYLSPNYADGEQMMINIGCTRDVNMEAFRQINLRLHDLFHKADLFKLGTYFIDEPGHKFKITLLINGIQDPLTRPEGMKEYVIPNPHSLKKKWKKALERGKQTIVFNQKRI